jgi:hypothetical protein
MEGLTRLVMQSMERHGLEAPLDHRRLQWSRWFRLESSLDLVLVPSKPGLFAVGEELLPAGALPVAGGKRMLAIFQVSDSNDLPISMSRLFAPGNPVRERIAEGRLFARYTVIEDEVQRRSAHSALQRWLASSAEAATGMGSEPGIYPAPESAPQHNEEVSKTPEP